LLHPALLTGADPATLDDLVPPSLLDDADRDTDRTVSMRELTSLTRRLAAATGLWSPLVRHDPDARWYTRLVLSDKVEVWLICWSSGQATAVHDHGGALGALTVAAGTLEEQSYSRDWVPTTRRLRGTGRTLGFAAHHIHRVSGAGTTPATSIHAYSPPGLPMRYAPDGEVVPAASPVGDTVRATPVNV
jgi:predicted metal-dependent enzyme (double-stranded beta helix superfamily)